jgi:lipopolysaccharide transport system ATP-binding protein
MSANDPVIAIKGVGKAYRIWENPVGRLIAPLLNGLAEHFSAKSPVAAMLRRRAENYYRDFTALNEITFQVGKGEAVGIVGRNGSGKSTLLQIIAGTLQPSAGLVEVRGRVAALLELGSGFNPEFSGRENVYLNGAVLGLSHQDVDERFEAIAAFAEIGDFIEQPVKTYSSGMVVRLAFAVAAHVDADVLIIDEALSVGDARFQLKCARAIDRFLAAGVTLLFVSHDPSSVKRLCNRAILLERGQMLYSGLPNDVINLYSKLLADGGSVETIQADIHKLQQAATIQPVPEPPGAAATPVRGAAPAAPTAVRGEIEALQLRIKALETLLAAGAADTAQLRRYEAMRRDDHRGGVVTGNEFAYGGNLGRISALDVQDGDGHSRTWFASGDEVAVKMTVEASEAIPDPIFALTIKNTNGVDVYGTNTLFSKQPSRSLRAGERRLVEFRFRINLMPGHYFLSFGVTLFVGEELVVVHRRYDAVRLEVHAVDRTFGIANLQAKITERMLDGSPGAV